MLSLLTIFLVECESINTFAMLLVAVRCRHGLWIVAEMEHFVYNGAATLEQAVVDVATWAFAEGLQELFRSVTSHGGHHPVMP